MQCPLRVETLGRTLMQEGDHVAVTVNGEEVGPGRVVEAGGDPVYVIVARLRRRAKASARSGSPASSSSANVKKSPRAFAGVVPWSAARRSSAARQRLVGTFPPRRD